jgi:hypothetical protein
MPKRARPGNRGALEAALTPSLLAALDELRELLNVHDWRTVPAVAATFTQAAVVLRAAQMVEAGVCSEKDAIDHASIALGVSPDTVRSRAKRWHRDSRALCTPTPRIPAGSFDEDNEPLPEVA